MDCYRFEPALDELLRDGAARLLMRSDGTSERGIRALMASVGTARQAQVFSASGEGGEQ